VRPSGQRSNHPDIRKGLELGAREYVIKTKIEPSEFLEKVSKLLKETSDSSP
jgi:DNA-binding NarL/FixJ family response regulator